MKCAACGFENGPVYEDVKVLFKSGKRKGEISHVETRETRNPQWARLEVERGFGFVRVSEEDRGYGGRYHDQVAMFACPTCGTVRVEG